MPLGPLQIAARRSAPAGRQRAQHLQLKSWDLDLLRAWDALPTTGSVTTASELIVRAMAPTPHTADCACRCSAWWRAR